MADEILKITVKSVQNVHPRVFGIANYEFIERFTKFNMGDQRWWMKISKMTIKSVQSIHLRVFEVADYDFIFIVYLQNSIRQIQDDK